MVAKPLVQYFRKQGWWTPWSDITIEGEPEALKKEKFFLKRVLTEWPGLACFRSPFLAWLDYHLPFAGFAHWLLYLFGDPFCDHEKEREKLRRTPAPAEQ